MAANKPRFINKFWPVTQIKASRTGQYKRILAERMEKSKYLIENTFGVKAERVVDVFIKAYLASDKDYPAPIDAVANPQSNSDFDLYNQYIVFLWNYYVKDKSKRPKIPKEIEPDNVKNQATSKQPNDEKKPGALSLYEGTKEEDLVDEQIDERILKLLGIQDIFDIDYGTYLSLLKERLVTISMGDKKIPREEQVLLQDEFKRVKGKVGRFKIKSKKITADNIGTTGPIRVSRQQFFLAGKVSVPDVAKESSTVGSSLKKDILAIKESIISIASLLSSQNKLFQKEQDYQRKLAENMKRSQKESGMESKGDKLKAIAAKVLAPVKGFLDSILNFIVMTLLGRLMVKFIRWFSDPKNKKKIDTLLRFIGDWWPSLLAGFILFATPLGGFIRTIIGTVAKLTFQLGKRAIPKLAQWVASNPITAGIVLGSAAAGIGAYAATQQVASTRNEDKKKNPTKVVTPEDTAKTGKTPGSSQLMGEQTQSRGFNMFRGGGIVPRRMMIPPSQPIKDIGFAEGGEITTDTGLKVSGAGPDTQLIAAQPGEIVISKPAVEKYGANFFLGLNKSGGGTNIPKMTNNIQLAAGGGMVGDIPQNPGDLMDGKKSPAIKRILSFRREENDFISPIPQFKRSTPSSPLTSSNILSNNQQKSKNNNINGQKLVNNTSNLSLNPKTTIYYPTPQIMAVLAPVNGGQTMADAAKESTKPIEQKMPFIMPLINNIINVLGKNKEDQTKLIQKPNVNISSNVKTYVPEPPVKSSSPSVIALPPMGASSKKSGYPTVPQKLSKPREIPDFPVFMASAHRKNNIQIYGIAGVM